MFQENFGEAWRLRFGEMTETEFPEITPFLTHRSVRNYSEREVPESLISGLVGAAQSAATSSNLQLWSCISVQNPEKRSHLAELTGNPHVKDAAWFFAFLADHHRLRTIGEKKGIETKGLNYVEFFTMAVIDATLAAERMVCAAEAVGLGICYIGGLRNNPEAIKQALNLPTGTFGIFGLCLGWPAEHAKAEIKPRIHSNSVWFREEYPSGVSVEEYDERAKAFFESQGMSADASWSEKSSRRVDEKKLGSRQNQLEWLRSQGFLQR